MGDLIDATPPELISKVFLEYKLFKTWFYRRSVLIGDGEVAGIDVSAVFWSRFFFCFY